MSSQSRKIWQISAILAGQSLALATMIYAASLGVEPTPQGEVASKVETHEEGECEMPGRSRTAGSGIGLDLSIGSPVG